MPTPILTRITALPAAIPCRVEWVEHLLGQRLDLSTEEVRCLAWRNLAAIIRRTDTQHLFPETFAAIMVEVRSDVR